jgi:hypothetical protein
MIHAAAGVGGRQTGRTFRQFIFKTILDVCLVFVVAGVKNEASSMLLGEQHVCVCLVCV